MIDHEHDEDGNCIPPEGEQVVYYSQPIYRFSAWSVAAIVATGIGGLFSVVGQAANLLSRECEAQANWGRQNYDLAEAQREYDENRAAAAEDLRRLIEGDVP